MKNTQFLFLLLTLSISCTQHQKQPQKTAVKNIKSPATNSSLKKDQSVIGKPIIPTSQIFINFINFWDYYTKNVALYKDFTAFNDQHKVIAKKEFLNKMNSGLYFPMALKSKDSTAIYQLQKIPRNADKTVSNYMKIFSNKELINYQMEGKKIPPFDFIATNGTRYTSANTKGKIVLFKCWFIGCHSCVSEFPALNKLVQKYKDSPNVLFISLALDPLKELKIFLSYTKFDYVTIPGQGQYMSKKLHVSAYPTHFLINKEGILVRVLPDDIQVAKALATEIAK